MKRGNVKIIILSIVVVIVFVAAAVFVYLNRTDRIGNLANSPSPINSAIATYVETSSHPDWFTYKHQRNGHNFQIRAPWKLSPGPEYVRVMPSKWVLHLDNMTIDYEVNTDLSLHDWVVDRLKAISGAPAQIGELQELNLNGVRAYKSLISNWEGVSNEYMYVFVQVDKIVYEIKIGNHINFIDGIRPYYDDVISSFKLLESAYASQPIDTSSWKKFEDSDLGLSFIYPSDWDVTTQELNEPNNPKGRYILLSQGGDNVFQGMIGFSNDITTVKEFQGRNEISRYGNSVFTQSQDVTFAGKKAIKISPASNLGLHQDYIFFNDEVLESFFVKYDSLDPLQQAIIDSVTVADTASVGPTQTLSGNSLLVATKDGADVVVKKIDIQKNSEKILFMYKEINESMTSGNLWEGLPPSVSLSNGGNKIAYTSTEGLFVYNFSTGTTDSLITKHANAPENSESPPTWSSGELRGVYIIATPHWSGDDQYISFSNSYYEGSNVKLYDLNQKKVVSLLPEGMTSFGTSYRIQWTESGAEYVLPNSGGYQTEGLFVGKSEALDKPVDYSQYVVAGGAYEYAGFSPNGKKIVTILKNNFDDTEYKINALDLDKKLSNEVIKVQAIQKPFFGDDNHIYYVNESDNNKLIQYNLSNRLIEKEIQLPAGFNQWEKIGVTSEGYIELWASVKINPGAVGSDSNRLVLFDAQTSRFIYESKLFKGFTTFLGFIK